MPQSRGSFTPYLGILFTRKRGLLLLNFFFFLILRSTSAATRSSRTLHFAHDVMQLHVSLIPHGRHHPAGIQPLLPDSDYTCSHDVTLRIPKSKPRSPRGSPREHMCSARP